MYFIVYNLIHFDISTGVKPSVRGVKIMITSIIPKSFFHAVTEPFYVTRYEFLFSRILYKYYHIQSFLSLCRVILILTHVAVGFSS